MMRISALGIFTCCLSSIYCLAMSDEVALSSTTLARWLEDKEVVEVRFSGPRMDLQKLRSSIKTKVSDIEEDFRVTPGEGGGTDGSFVEIAMKATPENVRRLLAIQEELSPHKYELDPKTFQVWSYKGNAEVRAKARVLATKFLTSVEGRIKAGVPKAQCSSKGGELGYEVPGTDVRGMIRVSEITATKSWEGAAQPEQTLHLPHLGLVIALYYRPAESGAEKDASAERAAIRKAFGQSLEHLLKLEPGATVSDTAGENEGH